LFLHFATKGTAASGPNGRNEHKNTKATRQNHKMLLEMTPLGWPLHGIQLALS